MRHELTLNIGLENLSISPTIPSLLDFFSRHAGALFDVRDFSLFKIALVNSGKVTEPTAIVVMDLDDLDLASVEAAIALLCRKLDQGAIAYLATSQENHEEASGLVGPRAETWGGKFNADYFDDGSEVFEEAWYFATTLP